MTAGRCTRRALCLSLLPWLSVLACGAPSTETRLEAYREAVRVLVVPDVSSGPPPRDVLLPGRRERRLPVGDHRVGLADFLALQGCRLGELVGERNSQLGRVMVPSRRLIYELELLEAAEQCLAGLADGRRAEIGPLFERKRAELPRHVWNAVWEDGELRDYLSAASNAFGVDPDQSAEYVLGEIERLLARRPLGAAEARELERAMAGLRGHGTAGALLLQLERSRVGLIEISDWLDGLPASGCDATKRRLVRVFTTHYVTRVQPDLAALDRNARPLVEALDAIYRASQPEAPPPSMQAFHRSVLSPTEGVWPAQREAVLRHAKSWEPTLTACNALPGGPVASAAAGEDA